MLSAVAAAGWSRFWCSEAPPPVGSNRLSRRRRQWKEKDIFSPPPPPPPIVLSAYTSDYERNHSADQAKKNTVARWIRPELHRARHWRVLNEDYAISPILWFFSFCYSITTTQHDLSWNYWMHSFPTYAHQLSWVKENPQLDQRVSLTFLIDSHYSEKKSTESLASSSR